MNDDMSDDASFDPSDQRAEDALRHSLARDRGWSSERVDTGAVRSRVRRRSRLRVAGAALAVVVVAGGVATGVELGSDDGNRSTGPTNSTQPLPPPDDGWRWDFYRDIRIQVPTAWEYGDEPGSDWCVGEGAGLPKDPYIALDAGGIVLGIGCPSTDGGPGFSDEPPTDLWATHVALTRLEPNDQASVSQRDGWWILKQPVGHVLVKAVGKDRPVVDRIVASATGVDDDSGGCSPHSPLQDSAFPSPEPAFDIEQLTSVDAITVCSYDLVPAGTGLLGVYTMEGVDADAELRALQAAPVGGGPDRPSDCYPDDPGDAALQLRLTSGSDTHTVHTMYVFYSSCHDNGFDDGTALRELTKSACIPLAHEPVRLTSGSSASFERCYSRPQPK
jgi:hypothetical protein